MNIVPEHRKLNIGCGFKKLNDHWNVDIEVKCNPDQVWDLDVTPWPWETDFFTHIHADNILEHVGQDPRVFTKIIKEMYRVSAPGAEWFICLPHHRCDHYFDDYTHVRFLTPKTFKMFDQVVNVESIKNKLSDSTFGLYHDVDIELIDFTYDMIDYWLTQQKEGILGAKQLEINLHTMSNVAAAVNLFLRVHKPGRMRQFKVA